VIDNQEAPITPTATRLPRQPARLSGCKDPGEHHAQQRGGGRIIGSTFNNALTFSVGHYVTFNDYRRPALDERR